MRPRGAVMVWLAGLLTGGLIASGATPALARPDSAPRGGTTLSARLAPPVVTVGEPAAVVARLTPAQKGRPVVVERLLEDTWTAVGEGRVDGTGRAVVPVDTSTAGAQVLQVVAEEWNGRAVVTSKRVTLSVLTTSSCSPKVPLVDPNATTPARCLAKRMDRWQSAGLMAVGQQLNMSNERYPYPLEQLGARRVQVIGFDLWELDKTRHYQFPFFDRALEDLVAMAQGGAVLTASWHAPNPHSGREYDDRSWHDLGALLEATPEAQTFWAAFDEQLAVLEALQDRGVAVVFRPFHEANGDWFWWGRPAPTVFKKLWREMQERAWAAGVHNVLWTYSFAARTRSGISDPVKLLPSRVDVAGIDSYHPAAGAHRGQSPSMSGYAAVAERVRRMAFTEIGPAADTSRTWKPSVISVTARALARKPLWSLLWVDDPTGFKQIASLNGGTAWLDTCSYGLCVVD